MYRPRVRAALVADNAVRGLGFFIFRSACKHRVHSWRMQGARTHGVHAWRSRSARGNGPPNLIFLSQARVSRLRGHRKEDAGLGVSGPRRCCWVPGAFRLCSAQPLGMAPAMQLLAPLPLRCRCQFRCHARPAHCNLRARRKLGAFSDMSFLLCMPRKLRMAALVQRNWQRNQPCKGLQPKRSLRASSPLLALPRKVTRAICWLSPLSPDSPDPVFSGIFRSFNVRKH